MAVEDEFFAALRGEDTPYCEARVSPPLKPHRFPARFRGVAPKNPAFAFKKTYNIER